MTTRNPRYPKIFPSLILASLFVGASASSGVQNIKGESCTKEDLICQVVLNMAERLGRLNGKPKQVEKEIS